MNAEQKQRAMQMLRRFSQTTPMTRTADNAAVAMADLLQELVDAPEAEPVARVTGYYAGYLSISTIDGRVLPACTALYLDPPAPSVPDGWKHDCAGILQNDVELWVDSCPHCGKPRPAAPTPAEAPADVARDAEKWRMLPAFLEEFQIPYLQLEGKIDAAIRARGEKGQS